MDANENETGARNGNHDRTHFTPPHSGANILPNSPIFSQLLRHARRKRLAVRDVNTGIEKTFADLLIDTITLRGVLRATLPQSVLQSIERGDEVFIGILAPGGYEYVVAVLATLAIGAAINPMTVALPVEEAAYFVRKSGQVIILTAASASELGKSIVNYVNKIDSRDLHTIDILSSIAQPTGSIDEILISSDQYLDDNKAGALIFTSGTTGPPKGAVLRRGYVHEAARGIIDQFDLTPYDVILNVLPVHHVTGIAINILPFILAGACVEFRSGGFDPAWTWNRWRQGGLTVFSGVPTIYMRMMRYYQQIIAKLPPEERNGYDEAARNFRAMLCGTSALPWPLQEFWTKMQNGRIILTRYGSTEVGAVLKVPFGSEGTPDGSVGEVVAGVDLKLSEGDEGEILVKSPSLFSKYLFDDQATAASFDEDGYFKTGDIARREGKYYFIVGRASQDIIKSGGYKISALDIEREILALPYIGEIMVVGVEDEEFGQRVGAVVTLREDQDQYSAKVDGEAKQLTIDDLRADLRSRLAGYKLPTLLRIEEGDLPKTASGKVLKKVLGPQLFPVPGWHTDPNVQTWQNRVAKL